MSSDTVVEISAIEASKENIQPLQRGRNASALSAALSATPHSQPDARARLAAAKMRYRQDIELAVEDSHPDDLNVLEAYSRFVQWTIDAYPQGHSSESGLIELLEEATRVLMQYEEFRNLPEYLQLWTLYSHQIERPSLIYSFLLANDICSDVGQMYEDYAICLERDGRMSKADEIYRLGIARKAEPLDHLESRYQKFQPRLLSLTFSASGPSNPAAQQPSASNATAPKRKILGETKRKTDADVFTAPAASSSNNKSQMNIFVDAADAEELAETSYPTNSWPDVGTRTSRVKENRPAVKKAAGTKLASSSKRATTTPAAPRFMPFRDSDAADEVASPAVKKAPPASGFVPFKDEDAVPQTPAPRKTSSTFIPFCDEIEEKPASGSSRSIAALSQATSASSVEALRRDPFRNYESGKALIPPSE